MLPLPKYSDLTDPSQLAIITCRTVWRTQFGQHYWLTVFRGLPKLVSEHLLLPKCSVSNITVTDDFDCIIDWSVLVTIVEVELSIQNEVIAQPTPLIARQSGFHSDFSSAWCLIHSMIELSDNHITKLSITEYLSITWLYCIYAIATFVALLGISRLNTRLE